MQKDTIKRTEAMVHQASLMLQTAYNRGYKDGEADERERHNQQEPHERETGRWMLAYRADVCDKCGGLGDRTMKYCPDCGARMR